jgi:hypothetical protein
LSAGLAVATGANAKYFPLLERCLKSIHAKATPLPALYLFDVGLEPAQRETLRPLVAKIIEPGWDFAFPDRERTPGYYRAQTVRPFLPRYLPGHRTLMWIDADAFLQDGAVLELFLRAAEGGRLAIVPELDRSYRNLFHAYDEFQGVIRASYREAFDAATAEELTRLPLLNSGAFALEADAPHWQAWAETLGAALMRTRNFLTEQAALNYVVYKLGLPAHFLPARCNWICHHAPPRWDDRLGLYTEPLLPHEPLGIVHQTMWTKAS